MDKRTKFTAAAVLVVVVIGGLSWIWRDRGPGEVPAPVAPAISSPMNVARARSDPTPTLRASAKAATAQPSGATPRVWAEAGDLPLRTTVVRLARDHPELGLSAAEAARLQDVYSRLCYDRARLEVRVAQIKHVDPDQTLVQIPRYRDEGEVLLAQLDQQIRAELGDVRGTPVSAALAPLFRGDNNGLGAVEQSLLVKRFTGEPYQYELVHEIRNYDPQTGKLLGTSSAVNNLPGSSLGVYAFQPEFFPSGK